MGQRRWIQNVICSGAMWDRLDDDAKIKILDMGIRRNAWEANKQGWLAQARWNPPRRSLRRPDLGYQDQIFLFTYEGGM